MKRPASHGLLSIALCCALAAFIAPAVAAAPTFDADAAWRSFLAQGNREAAYAAFGVLDAVKFDNGEVDAASCASHRDDVAKALKAAPVSIAVRRVAFLCAQAGGDDAGAERQLDALAALSRTALAAAGDPDTTHPIRVLAPADAVVLVGASGLQLRYSYYLTRLPGRYQPLVLAAWDAKSKTGRHYVFDFLDTLYTIEKSSPYAGNVMLRLTLVKGLADTWAAAGDPVAQDLLAVRDSAESTGVYVERLRKEAQNGGWQSATAWMTVCTQSPFEGCDEGLVDALLTGAERKHALPMLLLAFAHARGIGVPRDEAAAMNLLDGAQRVWPRAVSMYVRLWETITDQPLAAPVQARLERLAAQGSRFPQRFAIERKVPREGVELTAAELAFLAEPAENGNGAGYDLLAQYYEKRGGADQTRAWLEKAAAAGAIRSQAYLGSALIYGDLSARDPARGERLVLEAAQSGHAWAIRHVAERERKAGRDANAATWLTAGAVYGDTEASLDLADLFANEPAGVEGGVKEAVEIFRWLAESEDSARARRGLAAMALAGLGMKKDPAQARLWLTKDAERGDAESQTRLARGYLYGDFGAVDEEQGERWLKRAVEAKDADAYISYAGWLYHKRGTPQARAQALALWTQSIEAGYDSAYNELAWSSCTSPYPDIYDAARGMATVEKMGDPAALELPEQDTVAACYAAAGRFKEAVEIQGRATAQLDTLARSDKARYKPMADDYRKRLVLYEAGRSYVDEKDE